MKAAIKAGDDAKKAATYAGVQIGQQIIQQLVPGLSYELFGNESELVNKDYVLAGFIAGVTEKKLLIQPFEAQMLAMTLMEEIKNARFEEQFGKPLYKIGRIVAGDGSCFAFGLENKQGDVIYSSVGWGGYNHFEG
jgi:FKBP-type peptidyl-prolyl cis-trans isomerase FklB